MGQIVLVTGGARSGKSRFAESLCLAGPSPHHYIATCPRIPGDDDLDARISIHQQFRSGKGWLTLEEPLDLEGVLAYAAQSGGSALVECLGLWVNNLIFVGVANGQGKRQEIESSLVKRVQALCTVWRERPGLLVVVGQEAGWGPLPMDQQGRLWQDLLGCVRNAFAVEADDVWMVMSGIPLALKRKEPGLPFPTEEDE